MNETVESRGFRSSAVPFYPGIDVFGILSEYDHVYVLRMPDRRHDSPEPTHGPLADIEIKSLTQRNVQGTDATTNRSGKRSFYAYMIFFESLKGRIWKVSAIFIEGFLPCRHLKPFYLAFSSASFRKSRI